MIEMVDDLAITDMPGEISDDKMGDLELEFFRRYGEKQLLQIEVHGKEKQKKGTVIIPRDNSGSMGAEVEPGLTREAYAKVISMALLKVCQTQGRRVAILDYGVEMLARDVTTWHFTPGQDNKARMLESCEYFQGGGTRYEGWMRKAIELIKESEYRDGDIIHLSDGLCSVPDDVLAEFNAAKEAQGFKVLTIMIGHDVRKGTELRDPVIMELRKFSDQVITVQDMAAAMSAAGEAFTI